MGSRIRERPERVFEVFTEIARPNDDDSSSEPFILQMFPADCAEEDTLKSIPKFAFPCKTDPTQVEHFTFVLTDIEGKFKFGFCRHGTMAQTCLLIISHYPWFEIFYRLLNAIAEVLNRNDNNNVDPLLDQIYNLEIPENWGEPLQVVTPNFKDKFDFVVPGPQELLSIPESRNLTEYYNAIDSSNMMVIFASMLYERRILMVSRKLSRLTSCVHASAALLYPMFWQHLYIPVLPKHLIDYCSAPMPFLIGVHANMLDLVKKQELGDAVILDCDANTVTTEYDDLSTLPKDVVSTLKKTLKQQQTDRLKSSFMGDGVSRCFLRALVALIGNYREALRFQVGQQITFDKEAFITSRPSHIQPFLERMLQLQIFEQFINDRLELLNSGMGFTDEFEREASTLTDRSGAQTKYKEWTAQMKKQGKRLRSQGKEKWTEFTGKVKVKSKKAYKDLRSKMDTNKSEEESETPKRSMSARIHISPPTALIEKPMRPPGPDFSMYGGADGMGRRSSYDSQPVRSSRQYKVLDMDNISGQEQLSPRSVRRLTSSDDNDITHDLTFQRVSVGLLEDPDIKKLYKRSFSMEDITHMREGDEGGAGTGDLSYAALVEDDSSSEESVSSTNLGDISNGDKQNIIHPSSQTNRPQPIPAARTSLLRKNQDIHNANSFSSEPNNKASSQMTFFDPLSLAVLGSAKDTSKSTPNIPDKTNNNEPAENSRNSAISRNNAFYKVDRPPTLKRRSLQPMATSQQSMKEARSAFIQSESSKPNLGTGSIMDIFDPLALGSDSSLSSIGSGKNVVGLKSGAHVDSDSECQDDLLKEWNLDTHFTQMHIDSNLGLPAQHPAVPPSISPLSNVQPTIMGGVGFGSQQPVSSSNSFGTGQMYANAGGVPRPYTTSFGNTFYDQQAATRPPLLKPLSRSPYSPARSVTPPSAANQPAAAIAETIAHLNEAAKFRSDTSVKTSLPTGSVKKVITNIESTKTNVDLLSDLSFLDQASSGSVTPEQNHRSSPAPQSARKQWETFE